MAVIRDFIDGQFGDDPDTEEVGIGGFKLIARTRERYARTAEVPTTFLEDGSHVNDHIIRNPLTVSIEGNVSDVHLRPSPAIEVIQRTQREVGNITQYAPARTQAQLSVVSGIVTDLVSAVDRADAIIASGQQAAEFVGLLDSEAKSIQERFVDTMDSLYYSDSLFSIDMPFRTYHDMTLVSIEVERDNRQNALSFTLEAQQFRFAETQFVEVQGAEQPSGALDGQTKGPEDKGAQEGADVPQSTLRYLGDTVGLPF